MKTDGHGWNRLREQIKQSLAAGQNAVVACSTLKRKYRNCLRVNLDVKFVFLRGDYALIEKQLGHRRVHFMNAALLRSQFDDLEEPQPDEGTLTVQLGRTPLELVKEIKAKLHLASKDWDRDFAFDRSKKHSLKFTTPFC